MKHAKSDQAYVAGLRAHLKSGGDASARNISDLIAMVEWNAGQIIDTLGGEPA